MQKYFYLLTIIFLFIQCKSTKETISHKFAIVIHGGAGTILKENMSPELEEQYKMKLEEAVKKRLFYIAKWRF